MPQITTPSPLSVSSAVHQSPPVDLTLPYSTTSLQNKHILITGGASGFGAAFVEHWASAGASIIVADINSAKGTELVADLRLRTKNERIWFVRCDVTNWKEQVQMFKEAARLSAHGGIDVVVANAGIAGTEPIQMPVGDLGGEDPPEPDYSVLDVNLYGLTYTTQLAMWWLKRNPTSKAASTTEEPRVGVRDRHLLLVGSVAGLVSIPTQPLYGASKHAVVGLFRALRVSSFVDGVRVNMINPYFIRTPIVKAVGRLVLAGGGLGEVSDVVDAATRLCADTRIAGRALCIGPKVRIQAGSGGVDGERERSEWVVVNKEDEGEERAVWEVYGEDFEDVEMFTRRLVGILKIAEKIQGWIGWFKDVLSALTYGLIGR